MLWKFWLNPEFIRHRRAELRKGRAGAVAVIVAIVCFLTILSCWAVARASYGGYGISARISNDQLQFLNTPNIREAAAVNAYRWLLMMQFGVLTFWSLLSGAQGISRERERGTWDFQRTTRMLPSELLVGKLLGEPVLAYFIVLCSLPVTIVLGLLGHISLLTILSAYFVILIAALFIGLAGLWLSSLFESRSRGIGLIGAFAMYAAFLGISGLANSEFSGLGAFSPLTTLFLLTGRMHPSVMWRPTLFGAAVPWLFMTTLLYMTFGGWLALMLVRVIKKDLNEVKLLSDLQAVGCCAFLNFVLYATFNPARNSDFPSANDFVTFMAAVNLLVLFVLGLAMLTSSERLQSEVRRSARSFLFADGLQWPWLLISGLVSYLLLIWGLFAWKGFFGWDRHTVALSGIRFLVIVLFATSDVLFVQWCKLTRLRAPLLKGVLLLCLYYAASGIICGVLNVGSEQAAIETADVLTPFAAFGTDNHLLSTSTLFGIVLQLMAIGFLISAVRARVQQPKLVVATAT